MQGGDETALDVMDLFKEGRGLKLIRTDLEVGTVYYFANRRLDSKIEEEKKIDFRRSRGKILPPLNRERFIRLIGKDSEEKAMQREHFLSRTIFGDHAQSLSSVPYLDSGVPQPPV